MHLRKTCTYCGSISAIFAVKSDLIYLVLVIFVLKLVWVIVCGLIFDPASRFMLSFPDGLLREKVYSSPKSQFSWSGFWGSFEFYTHVP
jgi:hypothetical protein